MQAELQAKLRAETDVKLRAEAERMEAENLAKVQALLDEARAKQMAEKQTESQADGSLKPAPAANWLAASLKNADFEVRRQPSILSFLNGAELLFWRSSQPSSLSIVTALNCFFGAHVNLHFFPR